MVFEKLWRFNKLVSSKSIISSVGVPSGSMIMIRAPKIFHVCGAVRVCMPPAGLVHDSLRKSRWMNAKLSAFCCQLTAAIIFIEVKAKTIQVNLIAGSLNYTRSESIKYQALYR